MVAKVGNYMIAMSIALKQVHAIMKTGGMRYENHTVLLENGTVGVVSRFSINYESIHSFLGESVTVKLYDENGNLQRQRWKMVEVLEVAHLDQE